MGAMMNFVRKKVSEEVSVMSALMLSRIYAKQNGADFEK